jgi:Flp pilus assembly pilin Flp
MLPLPATTKALQSPAIPCIINARNEARFCVRGNLPPTPHACSQSSPSRLPRSWECGVNALVLLLSRYKTPNRQGRNPLKEPILKPNTLQVAVPCFARFSQDESGQDMVEYALLAALVATGSVAGTQNLAIKVANTFTNIQNTMSNAIPAASPGGSGGSGGSGGNGGGGRGGRGGGQGGGGGGRGGGFGGGGFGGGRGGGGRGGGGRGGR